MTTTLTASGTTKTFLRTIEYSTTNALRSIRHDLTGWPVPSFTLEEPSWRSGRATLLLPNMAAAEDLRAFLSTARPFVYVDTYRGINMTIALDGGALECELDRDTQVRGLIRFSWQEVWL